MNRTMLHRSLACAVAAALAAPLTSVSAVDVPAALRTADNEELVFAVPARGVQIYECRARKDGSGFEWAFVAPVAELFDAANNTVGHHGGGPTWEALDGSRVVGTVKARVEVPTGTAIPWLLLTAKNAGPAGLFRGVSSIQRVNTDGGLPPTAPCDAGSAGTKAQVPYSADYLFYRTR